MENPSGDMTPFPAAVGLDTLEDLKAKVRADGILLPYQKRYLEMARGQRLVVAEKSRRIGLTWAEAGDDVIFAATNRGDGGDDVSYIGYNLEMAREYISACGDWARAFNHVSSDIEEFMFEDAAAPGEEDRHIKAFRIDFGSGNKIVALSSKPRSLRGRRGRVVLDEAAFHEQLGELLDAAMALLVWGGSVRVISTHFGADNPFNHLIHEIRSGKREGVVFRCTFDEAVADGLYERVCLVKDEEPTLEGKQKWIDDIRGAYGDAAKQELDVIPSKSTGAYLPLTLLERQTVDAPVLRWSKSPEFTFAPPEVRAKECELWCNEFLAPILARCDGRREHALGGDFARSGDLSVMWPLVIQKNLERHPLFVVELDNIPYEQQRQILFYIIDRLPRFRKAALDAIGNGEYLAEVAQQEYGVGHIEAIKFSVEWYRENMPPFKSALEDQVFWLPKDDAVVSDFHMFQVIDGVARMPKVRTISKSGQQRHGDAGIAGVLAYFASTLDTTPIEYEGSGQTFVGDMDEMVEVDIGFGGVRRNLDMGGF